MKVTYEHKPAMTFIGFSTSIRPEEGYQKCPEFWDREYARKYARLPARAEHEGLAGVVSEPYKSGTERKHRPTRSKP